LEAIGVSYILASSSEGSRPDWGRINLVDGQSCLGLPEGTQLSPSLGFSSVGHTASKPLPEFWVSVDLGQSYPVDEIRLFPARPPAFSHSMNYGFPELYRIELRETEQSEPLIITPSESGGYEGAQGNSCAVLLGNGQNARYITLVTIKPQVTNGSGYLALSELEVWSGNQNIARRKQVFSSGSKEKDGWSSAALVDGFTSRANIVDPASWLTGLSHRRRLEHDIAEIEKQRNTWLGIARKTLTTLSAGCLVAAFLYVGFDRRRQRAERAQELQTLRRRFAQDLHDDIGSNLGSIVLMSEQAQELTENPELLRELKSIQETAGESVDGLRQLVDVNRDGLGAFLEFQTQIRALTERALHGLSVQAAMSIPPNFTLPAPVHRQVLLCLKEIFHNIRRHARARKVSLSISIADNHLEILVEDDGCGFDPTASCHEGNGLSNLRHRTIALGGRVLFQSALGQGTRVGLSVPLNQKTR
jgi:signal transduction histidine kinase